MTNEGHELTDFIYDDIASINAWSYVVRVGGVYDEENDEYDDASWGVINCIGEVIIPLSSYESYSAFSDYFESALPNIEYVKWLNLAADRGNTDAEYSLGCYYMDGDSVSPSYDKAIEYFQKASDKGERDAQYKLAKCLYERHNYEIAVKWFQKLAEEDYKDSLYYLGLCYFYGKGINKSYDTAFKCFRPLASKGFGYKQAKYMLGLCYFEGKGVEQSYEEAAKWFRQAGDQYWETDCIEEDDKPF